jgi:uncharacterized membrane protein YphA (DoxX/SURF4 family)
MTARKVIREVCGWSLALLLAAAFIFQGISKFPSGGGWARAFEHWGLPVWLRYATGVMEGGGGLLVLVPRLAPYGAASIALVMIGAAATHASAGEWSRIPVNGALLALCAILGWIRRPRRRSGAREAEERARQAEA